MSAFSDEIAKHTEERAAQGIVPLPLNAEQTGALVELVKNPPAGEEAFLIDQLENRVPPGVDEAAYVKVLLRCESLLLSTTQRSNARLVSVFSLLETKKAQNC